MTIVAKIAVFFLASAGLAFLTRRSLKNLHSHGVYRLLAWVASIALILLNLEAWFEEPFAIHQVVSWLLLLLSVVAVAYGSISLHRGKPDASRNDASLMGIEKTTELVVTGAYHYIRHPIYSSFLIGALGVFLKDVSWGGALLTGLISLGAVLAAKTEEEENLLYFGDVYRSYMKRTKMFIPFLL